MEQTNALIVGLGNPGKVYEDTRHNFGFIVARAFAKKWRWTFKAISSLKGEIASGRVGAVKVILLLPATYMNSSGQAVKRVLDWYSIDLSLLIVLTDDATLDFGVLRFREKGSSGGHKGLKSVELCLGTQSYRRLRFGIGSCREGTLEDYVLAPFSHEEKKLLPKVVDKGIDFLDGWLT